MSKKLANRLKTTDAVPVLLDGVFGTLIVDYREGSSKALDFTVVPRLEGEPVRFFGRKPGEIANDSSLILNGESPWKA